MSDKLACALDAIQRLPTDRIDNHIEDILELDEDLTDDLLGAVDAPLKVGRDPDNQRMFCMSEYNRDIDSFRSPWSNKYVPPLDDGAVPTDRLREMEIFFNAAWKVYSDLYYDGGITSVYTWEIGSNSFASAFLIKKVADKSKKVSDGAWDSIHVIEVTESGSSATYKMTTTVMLNLSTEKESSGCVSLGGSLTKQVTETHEVSKDKESAYGHMVNMGKMIEAMENQMRQELRSVYFGKTQEVMQNLHKADSSASAARHNAEKALAGELQARMKIMKS